MSPPFPLRRLAFLWAPLLVAGVLFFALAPFYAAAWCLIPITLVVCAIVRDLTEPHPTHA